MAATRRIRWGGTGWLDISVDPVPLDAAKAHHALGGSLVGMRGGIGMAYIPGSARFVDNYAVHDLEWHIAIADSWSAQPPVQKGD